MPAAGREMALAELRVFSKEIRLLHLGRCSPGPIGHRRLGAVTWSSCSPSSKATSYNHSHDCKFSGIWVALPHWLPDLEQGIPCPWIPRSNWPGKQLTARMTSCACGSSVWAWCLQWAPSRKSDLIAPYSSLLETLRPPAPMHLPVLAVCAWRGSPQPCSPASHRSLQLTPMHFPCTATFLEGTALNSSPGCSLPEG